jgi:hypothetical protein
MTKKTTQSNTGMYEGIEETVSSEALHASRTQMTLEERRGIRTDLGEGRNVMYTPPDDDEWHYHWANDNQQSGMSRIKQMTQMGYEVVQPSMLPAHFREVAESKTGSDNVSISGGLELHAGTDAQGQPMKTVLMRIPKHYHDLDKALREEKVLELESQITGQADGDGMYGDIKLR